MSIAGTWKVKKIMSFADEEPKLITMAEFEAIPEKDEEMAQMASSILDITEDGKNHNDDSNSKGSNRRSKG